MKTINNTFTLRKYGFVIFFALAVHLMLIFLDLEPLSPILKKQGVYYLYWSIYMCALMVPFIILDFKKKLNVNLLNNLFLGSGIGFIASVIAYSLANIWKFENGLERLMNAMFLGDVWAFWGLIILCFGWFYGAIAGVALMWIKKKGVNSSS